ncbi:MAG: NYN domain-containing protein [Gemmatimonadetes bacterium]|nr:NYN domain-containing protein [Gemmatimonadota bacterium]
MTGPTSRAGRQASLAAPSSPAAPASHAALLIDFDNVTMGIRSDLTKELKALLSSDIIRGKVTVQRAYADWRRYPQYVMPLTERSIDMIWATAVGSTKKNATDIRLAIDAIELVFTRPDIGTFIVLSGDSDFSSLVMKLKEYGKYVIGIGIRDSASDLLIQNCDEYFSYTELAGLHREVDAPAARRDPWELVVEAVERMVKQGDVMRSDRLKQVMQQIDSSFDERNAGINRFSKFVTEAATRGLLKVAKLDNGQYEVAPAPGRAASATTVVPAPAPERDGERRGGRGRGRGRDRRDQPTSGRTEAAPAPAAEPSRRAPQAAQPVGPPGDYLTLGAAFSLLTRALGELQNPVTHDTLRARMAALHGREDPLFEPTRFPRLLRQANDAEVADVKKTGEDQYEVALTRSGRASLGANGGSSINGSPDGAKSIPAGSSNGSTKRDSGSVSAPVPEADPLASRVAGIGFRRGSRGPSRPPAVPMIGLVDFGKKTPAPVKAVAVAVAEVETKPDPKAKTKTKGPVRSRGTKKASTAVPKPAEVPPVPAKSGGVRRGSPRSRGPRKPR